MTARSRFDGARLLAAFDRRVSGLFREQLFYKIAAVFLALVLWLVVSVEQPAEARVPVQLQLQLDTGITLQGQPPQVSALVVGRSREVQLLRLLAAPATIPYSVPGDADSVRVELRPDMVFVPTSIEDHVRVRAIEPNVVTLRLTTEVTRRVPIFSRLRITVDDALRTIGGAQLQPDSVTVRGTRAQVAAVQRVPTQELDVRIRDTSGVTIPLDTAGLGVQVQPSQVRLRVPVVRDTLLPLPFLVPWGRSPRE